MKSKCQLKKVFGVSSTVFGVLTAVLGVHIYLVTHQHSNVPNRVMARIDFKQDISETDALAISAWLYQQKGVDHVLCNPATNIAVFTFSPGQNDANKITTLLCTTTAYEGVRYLPSAAAMATGCPVAAGSWTSKLSTLIKRL